MEQVLLKEVDVNHAIAKAIVDENLPLVHDLSVNAVIGNPKNPAGYIGLFFVHIKNDDLKCIDPLINKIRFLQVSISIKNSFFFNVTRQMALILSQKLEINQVENINSLLSLFNINSHVGETLQERLINILSNGPISDCSNEFIDKIFLFIRQRPNRELITCLVRAYLQEDKGQEVIARLHQAGISHNVVRKHLLVASSLETKLPLSLYFYPHDAPPLRRTIVVAGPKKSASTFAARILALTLDYPVFTSSIELAGNLDVDFLMDHASRNVVIHTHSELTQLTGRLLTDFKILPLIPIRNVFDSLVSLKTRFDEIGHALHPAYETLDDQQKYEYIFRKDFPDLFNFYVSWKRAFKKETLDTIMISSTLMNENPVLPFSKFLNYLGVPFSKQVLENAVNFVDKSNTQSNVNQRRGQKLPVDIGYDVIPGHLVDIARQNYNHYPDVDFSLFDHRLKQ